VPRTGCRPGRGPPHYCGAALEHVLRVAGATAFQSSAAPVGLRTDRRCDGVGLADRAPVSTAELLDEACAGTRLVQPWWLAADRGRLRGEHLRSSAASVAHLLEDDSL
jgi:hypothetical protein